MEEDLFVVGQLAGPGTYRCDACANETVEYALSFQIEPCPCGGETFHRVD
ncbi:MAG: zinc ribbon-containing protein [Candidatus Eremiobacteraeota bacterium]|nr:zinc ribbon-containing protein [Candidatus Eremiobacteraeota bacterium]